MQHLWIDTDMGFDDLAAVLLVAAQPSWQIDGLSLVAGNAPLPVVIDNALRSAACFGWRMPIHAGCDQPLACDLVTAQNILGLDAMASAGRSLPLVRSALASADAVRRFAETHAAEIVLIGRSAPYRAASGGAFGQFWRHWRRSGAGFWTSWCA